MYETFTLFGLTSQTVLLSYCSLLAVQTPECTHPGLGSFPFARRYLGNHCCFLFLRLLRCFSSPGSLYMAMYSPYSDRSFSCRVSPFRNRRVNGYLLLTAAYRSLSRLSSALSAKASTLRSCSLDLLFQCISDNTPATVLRRWMHDLSIILLGSRLKNRFFKSVKLNVSNTSYLMSILYNV